MEVLTGLEERCRCVHSTEDPMQGHRMCGLATVFALLATKRTCGPGKLALRTSTGRFLPNNQAAKETPVLSLMPQPAGIASGLSRPVGYGIVQKHVVPTAGSGDLVVSHCGQVRGWGESTYPLVVLEANLTTSRDRLCRSQVAGDGGDGLSFIPEPFAGREFGRNVP